MKKRKPESVLAKLRKTLKPCLPAADDATTMTDEVSR
jgi:hypothetical protein